MSLEKIIERIQRDAKAETDKILSQASATADKIINDAHREADAIRTREIENAKKEAEQRKQRIISSANLEMRKNILSEKQKAIDSAFNTALNMLRDMRDEEYKKIIKDMIIKNVQTGDEEIILSKRDKERLGKRLVDEINEQLSKDMKRGNLKLADEVRDMSGGFILRRGEIELNSSFDSLFKALREDLEAEVSKILFPM